MKLNKKGFTLVELLAVVVILLAISTVAISSISAAIERNKKKQDNAKVEVILNYAKLYYQSHKNTLTKKYGENRACIELGQLKDLSSEEKQYVSGDSIVGVIVYDKKNKKNEYILNKDFNDCDYYEKKKDDLSW